MFFYRILVVGLLFGISNAPFATGQFLNIDLGFEQQSLGEGNLEYNVEVRAFNLFLGTFAEMGQVEAPDGTVFNLDARRVEGLDFQQVSSRFFGDWQATEALQGGGFATHSFAVTPFTLGDVFNEVPTIVSPVLSGEQGVVGTEFDIVWEYASGATPSSRSVSGGGQDGSVVYGSFGVNSVPVSVTLDPGITSGEFVFRAGSVDLLDSFISDATQDMPGQGSDVSVDGMFRNFSQSISLTVSAVPEPSSLVLCFAAMVFVGSQRQRT